MPQKKWTVYILHCADDTLYTGITDNLSARVEKHTNGTGAKYTRGRGPFDVVFEQYFKTRGEATSREYEIKKLSRTDKMALINGE